MQTPNDKMETFSDKFSSALKFVSGKISSKKVYVQNGDIVLDNSNMRSNVSLVIDSFVPSAPAEPKSVKSAWTV